MIMEIIFIYNPAFIICFRLIFPEPNTIALGGVATGSIKAQEHAMVAPANRPIRFSSWFEPNAIRTGSIILAVAVFEVISVKKLMLAITISRNIDTGSKFAILSNCPSQIVKSVLEKPFAIARPAPKRSKTPQGISRATLQVIIFCLLLGSPVIINKLIAPKIAIIVSSNCGNVF